MSYDPTNAATARALLEDAIALTTAPLLVTAQVDRAFALASSLASDGVTIQYLPGDLNKAAAWCWNVKAGMVTDKYDVNPGAGASLRRSQVATECLAMAKAYASGALTVTGTKSGIRPIGLVGSQVDPVTLINTVVPG